MTTERRIARPGPFGVIMTGLATFLASFAVLAHRVTTGEDPKLGPPPKAQVVAQRPVVVKRVIRRVVVTTIRPAEAAPSPAQAASTRVAARPAAVRPAAAPAPAAPAPAPAPAPVVTRSS